MSAALGGGWGNLESGGDLIGGEAFVESQEDQLAVFLREISECLIEFVGELVFFFRPVVGDRGVVVVALSKSLLAAAEVGSLVADGPKEPRAQGGVFG